jgi:plastocyanin
MRREGGLGMVRMHRWILAVATTALALWIATGTVLAADGSVTIASFAFDPATVTVDVGDSVTWTNNDSTAHTATAGDGSFDTGNIAAGVSATVTFDTAGTFAYVCSIHPQMTGSVVVEAAAATPEPTAAPTIGDSVSITPAPTDTLAAAAADDDRSSLAVTVALAALGILMLVGTFIADRRFRGGHHEE